MGLYVKWDDLDLRIMVDTAMWMWIQDRKNICRRYLKSNFSGQSCIFG